ncbi:MAG: T9SS type A sorting domain-containing protein [Candidatus Hydrothermia bacterium]
MGKKFAICQFFVKNETGETHDFYVSLELISQVGGTYENDTSEVLSNRLVSMYDGSANSAVGAIMLYPSSMYSYRADPWGNHLYDDNYYWIMMTSTQVDALIPGDQDGVYGVLNAGLYSTVPNAGTMYFAVGLLFGANKDEIQTVAEECLSYYEQYIGISEGNKKVKISGSLMRNNVISLNSDFDSAEVVVMDASGRVVQFGQIRGKGSNNINLGRGLQEGVYFLIVKSGDQSFVQKFVVVK